jgi:hypothetical protein
MRRLRAFTANFLNAKLDGQRGREHKHMAKANHDKNTQLTRHSLYLDALQLVAQQSQRLTSLTPHRFSKKW